MSIRLNVVGVRKYSFTDRDTGNLVEGVNVYYLSPANDENTVGSVPSKISMKDLKVFNKLRTFDFPCECDAITQQELTPKGVKTNVTDIVKVK